MRSPALDSSDSREMPYLLRKDKRLRYNADGSNNLVELIPDVMQMAKAAQPAFPSPWSRRIRWLCARVLIKRWSHQHEKTRQNCKPAFCTWLLANISDSSEKQVKEQEHVAFDTAKEGDTIVTLFTLLISTNNFYGQVASLTRVLRNRRTSVINTIILPGPAQKSYNTSSSAGMAWLRRPSELESTEISRTRVGRFYHFSVARALRESPLKEPPISMSTRIMTSRLTIRPASALHELTPTRPQGPPIWGSLTPHLQPPLDSN